MPPTAPVHTYPPGSVFTATWWVRVVRFPLIVVVLVLTGAALWPRGAEASLDDLITDLRAGHVVAVEIGEDSAFGGAVLGGSSNVVGLPGSDTYRVRWRTADDGWRTFLADSQASNESPNFDDSWPEPDAASIVLFSGTDPVLDALADELARMPGGSELYSVKVGAQPAFVPLVTLAIWLIVLGTLIHGPQPRWATKWAWFWLLCLIPYGLGFLALLALDAPWSRRASAIPPPLPHAEQRKTAVGDRRLAAGRAVVVAILATSVVISVALALLP